MTVIFVQQKVISRSQVYICAPKVITPSRQRGFRRLDKKTDNLTYITRLRAFKGGPPSIYIQSAALEASTILHTCRMTPLQVNGSYLLAAEKTSYCGWGHSTGMPSSPRRATFKKEVGYITQSFHQKFRGFWKLIKFLHKFLSSYLIARSLKHVCRFFVKIIKFTPNFLSSHPIFGLMWQIVWKIQLGLHSTEIFLQNKSPTAWPVTHPPQIFAHFTLCPSQQKQVNKLQTFLTGDRPINFRMVACFKKQVSRSLLIVLPPFRKDKTRLANIDFT